MTNKVLVIAHNFPPGGGVGMFRIAKFCKFLPEYGWKPYVLTTPKGQYQDNISQFENISDSIENIYRVPELISAKSTDGILWTPKIITEGHKIIKENDIDIILHTVGPFLPSIASLVLSKLSTTPYIIDMRDPWSKNSYVIEKGTLYDHISSIMEPKVLSGTSSVICATEELRDLYKNDYLSTDFVTITNGYDPDDFQNRSPMRFGDPQITYAGKFSSYRDPTNFLQAFKKITESYPDAVFVHVGNKEEKITDLTNEYGITENAVFTGYVDKSEVGNILSGTDIGLSISGGHEWEASTKVYDYMACKNRILSIGPKDGSMSEITNNLESATTVENNVQQIYQAILSLISSERPNSPPIEYNRRLLTKELADVLRQNL